MEILIYDIPEDGMTLNLKSSDTAWFRESLEFALVGRGKNFDGSFYATIIRTEENVNIIGDLNFEFVTTCDRCLEEYEFKINLPLNIVLLPAGEGGRKNEDEGKSGKIELMFYEGDRFDLSEMIKELVLLNLPMKHICSDDCRGICPSCGKNLNQGKCACKKTTSDSKWEALKGWSKRS